jgi:hypothetical protein
MVLNSVVEKDFWTKRGLTPEQRMKIVAGLDNSEQSAFEVGTEQRQWLAADLAKVDKKMPLIVFSHSPLYKYYRPWNFWTDDADEVQALLRPFDTVTVIHGHTHQVLSKPHRQYLLSRGAVDSVAMAVCSRRLAQAHRRDEPGQPVQPARRLRRRQGRRVVGRPGEYGLQPLGSQSDDCVVELFEVARQDKPAACAALQDLLRRSP